MKKSVYIWACCLAAALLVVVRGASASEFQITADSFTVANQLNVSSATFYQARSAPPPDPASATQLTTPGGLYFDGTYYNVWDRNALAWVRLSTGAGSGSVAAANVTAGTLGPEVIASSVAAAGVGTVQLADNSIKHEDMARGADTAVAGLSSDVALGLNADLLDGLDSSGFAAASSGVCYTSWAGSTCAGGWTAVVTGVTLMMSSLFNTGSGSAMGGTPLCARTDDDLFADGRQLGSAAAHGQMDPEWIGIPGARYSGGGGLVIYDDVNGPDNVSGGLSCAICCK